MSVNDPSTATKRSNVQQYHSTAFAAEYLGLSKRYLEALRLSGAGPEFYPFGKAVRYTTQSLDAWAAGRKRKSTSDRGEAA